MGVEEGVRAELLRMRKSAEGATVSAVARSPAICALLGNGDPLVAYNTLKHAVLEMVDNNHVRAAAYSLGFASDGRSHLDRLVAFGEEYSYEQRQVRRLSDRGVVSIARLVTSNWIHEAVPALDLGVYLVDGSSDWHIMIRASRLPFIEMRSPCVDLSVGGVEHEADVEWSAENESSWEVVVTTRPIRVPRSETVVMTVVWRGELWPKFAVTVQGGRVEVQTLGAKLRLCVES